jgi:hypothetical protein
MNLLLIKAKSGDRSYHMIDQAHILYERFVSNKYCDMKNDWKVITFFIGVSFESLKKMNLLRFYIGK